MLVSVLRMGELLAQYNIIGKGPGPGKSCHCLTLQVIFLSDMRPRLQGLWNFNTFMHVEGNSNDCSTFAIGVTYKFILK